MAIDEIQLRTMCTELKISALSQDDYEFLREFVTVIAPIADGITYLEGDKQLFGAYLPTLFGIKTSLLEMKSSRELLYCMPLVDAVYDGFTKRFKEMMNLDNPRATPLYLAMISDPKYKISFIPPSAWNKDTLKMIKNALLAAGERIRNGPNKENFDSNAIQPVPMPIDVDPSVTNGKLRYYFQKFLLNLIRLLLCPFENFFKVNLR